jgi:VanZ family protein
MWAFLKKLNKKMVFPVFWTAFTIFLLCIPGSDIPGDGLFSIEHLDKVAHVILFGGIVLFWGFWISNNSGAEQLTRLVLWTVLLSTVLGIGLEFLQRYAIPNRSFDVGDIWADFGGSAVAAIIHIFWVANGKKAN